MKIFRLKLLITLFSEQIFYEISIEGLLDSGKVSVLSVFLLFGRKKEKNVVYFLKGEMWRGRKNDKKRNK